MNIFAARDNSDISDFSGILEGQSASVTDLYKSGSTPALNLAKADADQGSVAKTESSKARPPSIPPYMSNPLGNMPYGALSGNLWNAYGTLQNQIFLVELPKFVSLSQTLFFRPKTAQNL